MDDLYKDDWEEEDFYDGEYDEDAVSEIAGITDTVTDYTYTDLEYPCILFREGFSCPKHQLKVVSNMVRTGNVEKDINLYFINNGEVFRMGMISGIQVSSFIEIIGEDNLIGFYEDGTKLEGDRLYVLCSF